MLDLLLPPRCEGCGAEGRGLCRMCRNHLQRRAPPWCPRCGEPQLGIDLPCPFDHRLLTGLRFARAPFRYAGTGGALVRRLKLSAEFGAAAILARAMAAALDDALDGPFRRAVLVPVPLHRQRRRARGFDQADVLAELVARRTGLGRVSALRRVRMTLPQGDPRVTSRERNVDGAFAAASRRQIAGRCVVLVDDVATSLATARGCAKVLRLAGAVEVALLTACRA